MLPYHVVEHRGGITGRQDNLNRREETTIVLNPLSELVKVVGAPGGSLAVPFRLIGKASASCRLGQSRGRSGPWSTTRTRVPTRSIYVGKNAPGGSLAAPFRIIENGSLASARLGPSPLPEGILPWNRARVSARSIPNIPHNAGTMAVRTLTATLSLVFLYNSFVTIVLADILQQDLQSQNE